MFGFLVSIVKVSQNFLKIPRLDSNALNVRILIWWIWSRGKCPTKTADALPICHPNLRPLDMNVHVSRTWTFMYGGGSFRPWRAANKASRHSKKQVWVPFFFLFSSPLNTVAQSMLSFDSSVSVIRAIFAWTFIFPQEFEIWYYERSSVSPRKNMNVRVGFARNTHNPPVQSMNVHTGATKHLNMNVHTAATKPRHLK